MALQWVTTIEVTLLEAVMQSGTEGMATCTRLMEEMRSQGYSSEDIHPALRTRVTKLTTSAQTQEGQRQPASLKLSETPFSTRRSPI